MDRLLFLVNIYRAFTFLFGNVFSFWDFLVEFSVCNYFIMLFMTYKSELKNVSADYERVVLEL